MELFTFLIALGYRLDDQGFNSRQRLEIFLITTASRTALGPTQPPIQWVTFSLRWAGHVACMGEGRGVYRVSVGKPEGKRPLGRPRRRWEDNIKLDLRKIGIFGANWIRLAQDRVQWWAFVKMVMKLRVP
jgi:hypothetical protein